MLEKIIICISDYNSILIELSAYNCEVFQYKTLQLEKLASTINFNKIKTYIIFLPGYAEQKIISHDFPYLSYINLGQLIQKVNSQQRAFDYDISSSFFMGRGESQFYYSFIFANLKSPLLDFIANIKENFKGAYFSSLESKSLLLNLDPAIIAKVILLYSYPNNITTIISNKYNIIKTFTNKALEHTTPRSIAGDFIQHIEGYLQEEASKTNKSNEFNDSNKDYRKISFEEESTKYNFYIIVPQAMKDVLSNYEELTLKRIILLTPYEAAILLKIENILHKNEGFSDILFAHNLILGKRSFNNTPKRYKNYFITKKCNLFLHYALGILISIFVIEIIFFERNLYIKELYYSKLEKEHLELAHNIEDSKSELEKYDNKYKEKINLYKLLYNFEDQQIGHIKNIETNMDIKKLNFHYRHDLNRHEQELNIEAIGIPKDERTLIKEKLAKRYQEHKVIIKNQENNNIYINIRKN